jgi:hypothetical protein
MTVIGVLRWAGCETKKPRPTVNLKQAKDRPRIDRMAFDGKRRLGMQGESRGSLWFDLIAAFGRIVKMANAGSAAGLTLCLWGHGRQKNVSGPSASSP